MVYFDFTPQPVERWTHFWAAKRGEVDRQTAILEWCTALDGNHGLYHYRNWSASGLSLYIQDPNQAFLFKMTWL